MFSSHDCVDTSSIFESQESESTRSTRFDISHNGTMSDRSKLFEIRLEGIYVVFLTANSFSDVCLIEYNRMRVHSWEWGLPSVVSQFKPPMNILLFESSSIRKKPGRSTIRRSERIDLSREKLEKKKGKEVQWVSQCQFFQILWNTFITYCWAVNEC